MALSLSVQPLAEADIPTFVRIELEAFRTHPRTPMIWRNGYTDELYAFYEATKTKSFHDPQYHFIKAVDAASGQIVGVSEWTFAVDVQRNAQKTAPDLSEQPPANWPNGGNWAMRMFYKKNLWQMLQTFLAGQPYILLDILTVNPEVHARGIGTQLLAWGVRQADEKGVAMCLESTPAGLVLYQKFGFKPVQYVRADMRAFGWEHPYDEESAKRVFMIREAKGASS